MSELELTPRQAYPHGTFCWADLGTSDPQAAKRFYTSLFGWSVFDAPAGEGGVYSIFRQGERDVAAVYQQSQPGVPPSWLSYVSVESVDRTTELARSLGAEVIMDPLDVVEAGRMVILRDPTGAAVGLWEERGYPGAGALNEPGAFCWFELTTHDPGRAGAFYSELLGWGTSEMEMDGGITYTVFRRGEESAAGMMRAPEPVRQSPAQWGGYFWVENSDAMAERAWDLGGQVLVPPTDIPGIGRYAMLQDPLGASFSVLAPQQQADA